MAWIAAAALLLALDAAGAATETIDQIYAAAKAEKTVVLDKDFVRAVNEQPEPQQRTALDKLSCSRRV
jgi:hypothetical protein